VGRVEELSTNEPALVHQRLEQAVKAVLGEVGVEATRQAVTKVGSRKPGPAVAVQVLFAALTFECLLDPVRKL
jgi:hypothetical protein